jgi:ABC-type glycerol-3-phosphate transport system substrate-binding protein
LFLLALLLMLPVGCTAPKVEGLSVPAQEGEDMEGFTVLLVGDEANLMTGYRTLVSAFQATQKVSFDVIACENSQEQAQVFQEMMDEGKMPDVVLMSAYSEIDYRGLARDGLLLDLAPHMEAGEGFQKDDYYMPILEAGRIFGGQHVMPIGFNLPALLTSQERMDKYGLEFDGRTGREIVNDMLGFIDENEGEEFVKAFYLFLNTNNIAFMSAALGQEFVDYETMDPLYQPEDMRLYAQLIKRIWEDSSLNIKPSQQASLQANMKNYAEQSGAILALSGGNPGGLCVFDICYGELSEDMRLFALPAADSADERSAIVTAFAIVSGETKAPATSVDLIRYVTENLQMNYFAAPATVSRKAIEKTLAKTVMFQYGTLSDAMKEAYRGAVESITGAVIMDNGPLNKAVWDCFNPYFYEGKTFEECLAGFETEFIIAQNADFIQ